MKRKFQHIAYLLMVAAVITSCGEKKQTSEFPDWAWADFQRPEGINPIVSPDTTTVFYCPMRQDSVAWESSDTFNPAATIYDGKVVVLYRAEDNSAVGIGSRTSRLGYAYSDDGLHFNRMTVPVFYPADDKQKELEWPGGCEDPRVAVTEDGLYVMLYTQWNRKQARLAVATSRDLQIWEKYGPAFAKAYGGRFFDEFSKSASMVTKLVDGKQVIAKIDGKYWMYWGEKFVNVATSTDLINWIKRRPFRRGTRSIICIFNPNDGRIGYISPNNRICEVVLFLCHHLQCKTNTKQKESYLFHCILFLKRIIHSNCYT
jgi:beta-1,2-mannosidase